MAIAGSSVVVAKVIVADLPVFLANELRFLLASLLLVPIAVVRTDERPRLTGRDLPVLLAQALTGAFLFNVCLFYGVRLTSAAQAGIVTSTTPVVVGLLAVLFLDERLTWLTAVGLVCAAAGVLLIQLIGGSAGGERAPAPVAGNALVLGAVVCEALFTVLGKAVADRVTPLQITTAVSVIGAVLFLPFAVHDLRTMDPSRTGVGDWIPVVYYGVVVTVVAFVLWFRGVSMVPASTAAPFTGVFPVSAVVLSHVLLGEQLRWFHAVGAACVIVGIWFTARGRRRPGQSHDDQSG
jgi:drug/metabolite transporter (DMT)-like permease